MIAIVLAGVCLSVAGSLFFSTLTYSLRDYSRARLEAFLERGKHGSWLTSIVDHTADLIFITALGRLLCNVLVLLGMLLLLETPGHQRALHYLLASIVTLFITLFTSVAIPTAAAKYAPEPIIGIFAPILHFMRLALLPVTKIRLAIDNVVRQTAGISRVSEPQHIEQEILSVVEEGEKEGVVDEQEREMIQSVIEFRDTQSGQIMTARTEIVALPGGASLSEVKTTLEESGHSRVPVYDGTLDHIVGILYARDLLKHLGLPPEQFDIRSAMRPAVYVPETKPLRDLLQEFRAQKVHIAIVLDEYGGTAGLVTIEDILEELVGDISDEHEPLGPAMLKRVDDRTWEADARMYVDELNRRLGLALPEDAGYDTLGGFISNTLGRIPAVGTQFEHNAVRFTILQAEPARVIRVKIELPHPIPAAKPASGQRPRAGA